MSAINSSYLSPAPPVRRRGRRRLWVAAAIVGVVAVGTAASTAWVSLHRDTQVFDAAGITSVVLQNDAGDFRLIAGGQAGTVNVTSVRHWSWSAPEVTHSVDGGILTIDGRCSWFTSGGCSVDQTISIPAGIPIRAQTGAGDIHVSRLTADHLDLTTSAGDISIEGSAVPDVKAVTSAGDITADIEGTVSSLTARTSAGDVVLAVPAGPYRVDATTAAGDVTVGVAQDPKAAAVITVQTSAGDITIRSR